MATELGKAYVQIIPSAQGISGSISQAIGGEAHSAGKSAGLNLVNSLKGVIATAGIGAAFKSALDAGGALQQSYGGLDTIYGEAADAAKKYAAEAAAAGISANDYAEQAVSFGASLKQAFSGDTTKAVEAANTAIMDMQDNSAKMGTDLSSIQNAYQGFAKQNYTMLDNLKLGYGGTKKEMERLLEDATKLSGVEYNIDNLGDVYEAIHVIQDDLGLTGVAAAEASDTFTGSMGAMKAAAENVLANLALGEDITTPLKVLVGNAKVFLTNNLLPMIKNIISGIPTIINELITNVLPDLINEGVTLISGLGDGMKTAIPEIINNVLPMLADFASNLRENTGILVDAGISLLQDVATGVAEALPDLITSLPSIVSDLAGILNDNLPKLTEAAWNIVTTLAQGIVNGAPQIMAAMPQIIQSIVDVWRATNFLQIGVDVLNNIVNGILSAIPTIITTATEIVSQLVTYIINALPTIVEAGASIIGNLIFGIIDNLPQIIDSIVQINETLLRTLLDNLPKILETGIMIIGKLIAGLIVAIPKLIIALPQIFSAIKMSFEGYDWKALGKNLLEGVKNGILNAVGDVVEAAKQAAGEIWNAVKSFFKISSPSKLMEYAGEMLDQGFAIGITDNTGLVDNAITELNKSAMGELETTVTANYKMPASNESESVDGIISLLNSYLPQIVEGGNVSVSLEGDAQGIFNVVKRQNKIFKAMNGESAFA